jgi:Domain of unknown function (DUF4159)/Aerotolerance regulator N-terminal
MIGGLPLGFAEPLVLIGLLTLPALWWLLRLIPPRPQRINFPPTRLLMEIAPQEETPARTPWWLTLLRLLLAALVIVAAAGPLWNPPLTATTSRAPIAILIDDGWAAAATWDARLRTADDIMARAETDRRAVALIPLSEGTRDISFAPAASARVRLQLLKPKAYTVDRTEALPAISRFLNATRDVELVWLSDGIDLGHGADFAKSLAPLVDARPMTIVAGGVAGAHALTGADNAAGALSVKVLRANTGIPENGTLRALDLKGLPLGEAPFAFASADQEAEAKFDLPLEIRNDIARIEIASERSSGAVQLLDKRWRRRTVGIISGATADTSQPLLSSSYYISRALGPFADVRLAQGESPADAVNHFLDQHLPMLVLADVGNVAGDARERLEHWIEDGGVLVRFAGPRLAASDDDLVPVRLRRGGRILGGSLSWDKPQPLAAFSHESPFSGMSVPNDVTVSRQVLAEPDAALSENTWATLADGTPLVTAAKRGKGLIVLFHVTGDTRWSDLPLSGTFVDMLKRIVALAGTPALTETTDDQKTKATHEAVAPTRVLDGFGNFTSPPATARPVPTDYAGSATAEHPPGFYGPPENLLAVNTLSASDRLAPLDFSALAHASHEIYRKTEPQDLRGPILIAALALFLLDTLIVLWLGGNITRLLPRLSRASTPAVIIVAALSLMLLPHAVAADGLMRPSGIADRIPALAPPASPSSRDVPRSALETKLAYVITGDRDVDQISKSGLGGLTLFLAQRTALEAGEPIGLDIAHDELAFYPLIYWPIVPGAPRPSQETLKRVDSYMKQGGTVLFDTRDAMLSPPGSGGETRGPGMLELRQILSSLDLPELEPVPRDHVLTKTFYLLRDFPGRFNSGQLWVEALPAGNDEDESSPRPARGGDGVSSIIITSNDFAGAWALQPDGQPSLPMVEGEPRQRELAFRAGVNIVMYTLTGNYKADQVHVPALLERLGQ